MRPPILQIACLMVVIHESLPLNREENLNELVNHKSHKSRHGSRINSGQGKNSGSRRQVDAQDSWLSFVRRSKRIQNDKQSDRKRNNKRMQRLIDDFQSCPPGPPGPRGPPGPPGPKGARVTIDVLMDEFKDLVREASEKRANELVRIKCPDCADSINSSSVEEHLAFRPEIMALPRLTSGFHLKLRKNTLIIGKTLMEIDSFHQPFASGAFHRGHSFNVRNGRFSAPVTGIYQFSVNLHIRIKRKPKRAKLKRKDVITSQICIDSLCQHHTSLQHLVGLESSSRVFTASFSGFLQLQIGQYASVYVDNASNLDIVVKSQSDFSGVFIGT